MASNKRPPLEMDDLTNNLKQSSGQGIGAFFPTASSTPLPKEQKDTTKIEPSPTQPQEVEEKKLQNEAESSINDVTTSSRHDVSYREWRDIIENTETHNSALRITNEERYDVEDLVSELRRKYKVKTSMNELARLGLLYIVQDFKKNKTKSLIHNVKKS